LIDVTQKCSGVEKYQKLSMDIGMRVILQLRGHLDMGFLEKNELAAFQAFLL
jgi:hypothetical protein